MSQERKKSGQLNRAFWGMALFLLLYLALAVACLWQYGSPHPLARINLYTGGALLISVLMGFGQLAFSRGLPQTAEVQREAFGMNYDAAMAKWISLLSLGELAVFLDYGQWHLVPALENRALQSIGLVLYLAALFWLRWVDIRLTRHFVASSNARREVIKSGPFRYLRHPRYAGLMTSRIAFALVFASPIAWLLALGWFLAVRRRMRREEAHLQEVFGQEYEIYMRQTARLVPGIY
jgi:protein-S-isoprenylcysteine O-methyltransferase Ste14